MSDHPEARLSVVSLHLEATTAEWAESIAKLAIPDTSRWTNYLVTGKSDTELIGALGIAGLASESYLVDPGGCVVHSNLYPETWRPVISRALEVEERCDADALGEGSETRSAPEKALPKK